MAKRYALYFAALAAFDADFGALSDLFSFRQFLEYGYCESDRRSDFLLGRSFHIYIQSPGATMGSGGKYHLRRLQKAGFQRVSSGQGEKL